MSQKESIHTIVAGLPSSEEDSFRLMASGSTQNDGPIKIPNLRIGNSRRHRPFGTVDYLILSATKEASSLLGVWLAKAFLTRSRDPLFAELPNSEEIGRLAILPIASNPYDSNLVPEDFVWVPESLQSFLESVNRRNVARESPCFFLADENAEWGSGSREILWFGGEGRALSYLAQFFLNFGLPSSEVNYEYLKEYYGGNFGSEDSCEMRIELSDAWTNLTNET